MRILLCVQRLWRGGGTETHVLTLAHRLKSHGHSTAIYTSGGPWVSRARRMGIPVYVDEAMQTGNQIRYERFRQRVRTGRFQVVHAHDASSLQLVTNAFVGRRQKPKIVFTVHGLYVGREAVLRADRQASATIAVSRSIRSEMRRQGARNVRRMYTVENGIDGSRFGPSKHMYLRRRLSIPKDAFVIGYASRFTFEKAALGKRVISALRPYVANKGKVHLIVSGRNAKKEIAGGVRVHVLGHMDNMREFFAACDVVVATGRTAAEALFCQVPVLALGNAGYRGAVTRRNLTRMIGSNFSDHGANHPWTDTQLLNRVRHVRHHHDAWKREAKAVRKQIRRQLSADVMAGRISRIYRNA